MDQHSKHTGTITGWLENARAGDETAISEVITHVYSDIRRLSSFQLRKTGSVGTMQTTALANEAVIRLIRAGTIRAQDRRQLYAFVADIVHNALIDELRAEMALKRRPRKPYAYFRFDVDSETFDLDLIDLDDALRDLYLHDQDSVLVIMQRFYAGRSLRATAEAMGWTLAETRKHWDYARAWLLERLGDLPISE
ncbi:MAG: ECF-type sigma factor [Phycisphaerales bacterium]|nr:ECF-type sigma factor [Phycisphaerales bacterium]